MNPLHIDPDQSPRLSHKRKIALFGLIPLLLIISFLLAALNTSRLLAAHNARAILSGFLHQPVQCQRVEASFLHGYTVYGATASAGPFSIQIATAEIRLRKGLLFLGLVRPSLVRLEKPEARYNCSSAGTLAALPQMLLAQKRPPKIEVKDGSFAIALAQAPKALQLQFGNLNFLVQEQPHEGTRIQVQFTLSVSLFGAKPLLMIDAEHQGILYRSQKEYILQSLNLQFHRDSQPLGQIHLDRSVALNWDPQSPFTQVLPAELACNLQNAPVLPLKPYLPSLLDSFSTGTLSCDIGASIGGGGRLLDLAGWAQLDQPAKETPSPLRLWSNFELRTDLATGHLHNYLVNAQILEAGRARGKIRLRRAIELDSGNSEGTLSIENLDLPLFLSLIDASQLGLAGGTLSVDQAWKWGQDASSFTATGEADLDDFAMQKGIKDTAPLSFRIDTNLLLQNGRFRGAWPDNLFARIHSSTSEAPLDALTVALDLASQDVAGLNRIAISTNHLALDRYLLPMGLFIENYLGQRQTPLIKRIESSASVPPFYYELSCDELDVNDQPLKNLQMRGSLTHDLAELTSCSLTLDGGKASLYGACNLAAPTKQFGFTTAARALDLQRLSQALGLETLQDYAGIADWKGSMEGAAGSAQRWKATGDLTLSKPDLSRIPQLTCLLALPGLDHASAVSAQLTASIHADPNHVEISQGALRNRDFSIKFNGRAGSDGSCNYLCDLALAEPTLQRLNHIDRSWLIADGSGFWHFPAPIRITRSATGATNLQFVLEDH